MMSRDSGLLLLGHPVYMVAPKIVSHYRMVNYQ